MKRDSYLAQVAILAVALSILIDLVTGGRAFAEAQEGAKESIQGLIPFDFPDVPEAKIEVNLSGKLISLVAKAAKQQQPEATELIKMLTGVYVRVYDGNAVNVDNLIDYYENKLKKEKWEVITKIKEETERVQVRMLIDQEMVRGIFVMVAEPTEIVLVNIIGQIDPEKIGALLENMGGLGLPQLKDMKIEKENQNE